MQRTGHFLVILFLAVSVTTAFASTTFYANGAFTVDGIKWCEENESLYKSLGEDKFLEHHKHSIEARICAYLINDYFWNYHGENRVEKLIERSRYYAELEIAKSMEETNHELSVKTDKLYYTEGDTIIISGKVTSIILDAKVTLQVFHDDNLVDIAQIIVAQDKTFTNTMHAVGPLWQEDGTYIVRVSYGDNYMVETSFEFFTSQSASEFSLKTDKLYYVNGDTIIASGFIKNPNQDYPVEVSLIIRDPSGNLVSLTSILPNQDGTYKTSFTATGTFREAGEYIIQASYSGQKAHTAFQFAGGTGYTTPPPPPPPDTTNPTSASKTKPSTPSSLVATAVSQNQINLSWKAPTNDGGEPISGYKIEVREDNGNYNVLASNTGKSTLYSHTGLKTGITYHYRVSAINSIGTSTPSAETSTTTQPAKDSEPKQNIPDFIDPKKGAQYYLDRYYKEPAYKKWFDTNFPDYTIEEAIELANSGSFPNLPVDKEPTQAIKPKLPDWIRNIFIWYAEDRISEDDLLGAIQFLLDQGILKK